MIVIKVVLMMSKFLTLSMVMIGIVLLLPYSLSANAVPVLHEDKDPNPILVISGPYGVIHTEEESINRVIDPSGFFVPSDPNAFGLFCQAGKEGGPFPITIIFTGGTQEIDYVKCVAPPPEFPGFVLSAAQSAAGSQVSISGIGFAADSFFDVFFDNTNVFHGMTDPGSFAEAFTVPATATCGPHTVQVTDSAGTTVTMTYTVTCANPVGGIIIPVDMTSLFVAGIFTNAYWMLPTFGGVVGAIFALFKIKRKHD